MKDTITFSQLKRLVKENNEWDWLDAELHRGKYAYDIDARCDVCGRHLSKSDEIYKKNPDGFIVCMKCHDEAKNRFNFINERHR